MPHYSPYLVIVLIVVRLVFLVMAWCAKLSMERAQVQGLAGRDGHEEERERQHAFGRIGADRCQRAGQRPGRGERDGPG